MDSSFYSGFSQSYSQPGPAPGPAGAEYWTREENRQFEVLLGKYPEQCSTRFELIASHLPGKSINQVLNHYKALVFDLEAIEAGRIPMPEYPDEADQAPKKMKKKKNPENRWTADEHRCFLIGLAKAGKGHWRYISRHYVKTKSSTQVASHAQKYFKRLADKENRTRKRKSIHDLTLSDPTPEQSTSNSLPIDHEGVNPLFPDFQLPDLEPVQLFQHHQVQEFNTSVAVSQQADLVQPQQQMQQQSNNGHDQIYNQQQQAGEVNQGLEEEEEPLVYHNSNNMMMMMTGCYLISSNHSEDSAAHSLAHS